MGKAAFLVRSALASLLVATHSPTPAAALFYDIRYDHYLNVSSGTATPMTESGTLHATPSFHRDIVYDGPGADDRAEVRYFADIARGTLGSYTYCTGDVVPVWPFVHTATARVTLIGFELDLDFDVPAGTYAEPVVVSLSGEAVGSLTATTDAGAMVRYQVAFGETHYPPLKQILVEEARTIEFSEPFTLDAQLLPAGAVLTAPARYTVKLTAYIENNWTWAVQGGVWPDYTTGSAEVDVYDGLRFLEVIVPPGVTWTSPDDVFLSLPAAVDPRPRPERAALAPNVPNPFASSTTLAFELRRPGRARLRILDLAGRVVRTLVEGDLPAGEHHARWDGRDGEGLPLPSGVYFGRFETDGETLTRRLLLTR